MFYFRYLVYAVNQGAAAVHAASIEYNIWNKVVMTSDTAKEGSCEAKAVH